MKMNGSQHDRAFAAIYGKHMNMILILLLEYSVQFSLANGFIFPSRQ